MPLFLSLEEILFRISMIDNTHRLCNFLNKLHGPYLETDKPGRFVLNGSARAAELLEF
jgi:hypothetical protein